MTDSIVSKDEWVSKLDQENIIGPVDLPPPSKKDKINPNNQGATNGNVHTQDR